MLRRHCSLRHLACWVTAIALLHLHLSAVAVAPQTQTLDSDYPLASHWPYGASVTSETLSGAGNRAVFFGEGTALRIAEFNLSDELEVIAEVRTGYPVQFIDVSSNGRLLAVSDGAKWVTLIDISNRLNPIIRDRYEIENGRVPQGVKLVDNDLLLVAVTPAGLWALDISAPDNIALAGQYIETGTNFVFDVEVLGDYAFLADDEEGLSVIDISNPASMSLNQRLSQFSQASHISLSGTTAFVSRRNLGVSMLDIDVNTTPPVLTELGTVDTALFPSGFGLAYRAEQAANGYLAVADGENGVVMLDISTPASPQFLRASNDNVQSLSLLGNLAIAHRHVGYNNSALYGYILINNARGAATPLTPDFTVPVFSNITNVDVDALNRRVVASSESSGLVVIDASDPNAPETGAWFNTGDQVQAAVLIGQTVAYADSDRDLKLVDVSDPANPVALPAFDFGSSHTVSDVVRFGDDAVLVATGFNGIKWLDLSDPLNPVLLGQWSEINNTSLYRLAAHGDVAVAISDNSVWVVDFSTPASPVMTHTFSIGQPILDADLVDNLLYLAAGIDGLRIWDIGTPGAPLELSDVDVAPAQANGVSAHNQTVYVAGDAFFGLLAFDVSDPTDPQFLQTVETPGTALKVDAGPEVLALADEGAGVRVFSARGDVIFIDGFD